MIQIGFSTISSHMILFIAVLLSATLMAGVFKQMIDSTGNSMLKQQSRVINQLDTEIAIEVINYNASTLNIFARNIGDATLRLSQLDLYINGIRYSENQTDVSLTLLSDTDTINPGSWDPKELINYEVNLSLNTSITHNVYIVTANGVKDYEEFTVN